jgi:cytochrome c2
MMIPTGWSRCVVLLFAAAACTDAPSGEPAGDPSVSATANSASANSSFDTTAIPQTRVQSLSSDSVASCKVATEDSSAVVARGARIFRAKSCTRCHTIGAGYKDGPDLQGVTDRHSCAWVAALLSDTEEMIQTDPDLQQLRIEHFLDMPNPNLSVRDAQAVYAYLRAASLRSQARAR